MALNLNTNQTTWATAASEINEKALDKTGEDTVTGRLYLENTPEDEKEAVPKGYLDTWANKNNIRYSETSDIIPISLIGSFDTFKEYVAKTDIYSLSGKTHNNIRYILYNGYMYSLNLLTKEFKKISDIVIDNSYKFFIGKDEKIYLLGYSLESYIGYISIYEYSLEYSELLQKNKIKVTGTITFDHVCDVEFDGENIYVGLIKLSSPVWHSLYKIKYEEMETLNEVSEIYGFYASRNDYMFCAGKDLIFNNKIFKNGDVEEITEPEYTVYGCDGDNLLVKGSNVFMIDKNTMEPKIIRTDKTTDTSGFMHDGCFYQVIGGFIVKLRLL